MNYIRTKYGEIFDLKTTSKHLFVIRDKTKEGKNCYVSWLCGDWENYFLIDEQNCVFFSYNSAQSFISDLMLKHLNYNNLVIELHPSFKEYRQSDDLKELFDGYYLDIDNHPFDTTQIYDKDELQKALKERMDWQNYSDRKGLEYDINLYAFIKTDKGFVFVAKINEKGNPELL